MPEKKTKQKYPENPQIGLDSDQSAAAAEKINEFVSRLLFLRELLAGGACPESSVTTHLELARHDYTDLAALLHRENHLDDKTEEAYSMLRQANQEIHQIKQAMGESMSPEQAVQGWIAICEAFESWFALKGFDYARCEYGPHGVTAEFSHETHPDRSAETRIFDYHGSKPLKYAAADFTDTMDFEKLQTRIDGHRSEILDTGNNHEYIKNLFNTEMPGSRIHRFSSILDGQDYLMRFEAFVPYSAIIDWKRRVLKTAMENGKARTGQVYLDYLDACTKLNSRDWQKYAGPDQVKAVQAEKHRLEKLILKYETMASNSPMADLNAWLAENQLDASRDFEGTLFDGYVKN